MTRRVVLWLALAAVAMAPAGAASAQTGAPLDAAAQADIARVERYLNELTTLDSRFVQFSAQGIAEGRIVLSRPGDLRIEYEPPVPVLMVASGFLLMYHDRDLRQTSFLPVGETPASFLLKDNIELTGDVVITDFVRDAASIRFTIVESDEPAAGSVTLIFEDKPLRLVKWHVIDAQGNEVDVALLDPKFGVAVDSDLFSLVDPALDYPEQRLE